ncbi:YbjN domain-containing protein [Candidatus Soleaferrea massiliensis]|uniref:YbjN domain-containing protein n=1 Tax=Candidatus Soleaferrea massiliensis TaxID=1470354 RepID=UPI00058EB3F3|nr:YbjN domain-containing protein [Candidatus Soleaferrea massiliensis]
MNNLASNLRAFFDEKGLHYTQTGKEEEAFILPQRIKDSDVILKFLVVTKPEDSSISIYAKNLCAVKESGRKLLELLNEFNRDYRWISFYVDNDNQITLLADSNVTESNVGDVCLQLIGRAAGLANLVYPKLKEFAKESQE